MVCAALAWVAALRRRVAAQTQQIRKQLESEAATERRLALVWEASADGMCMTDADGLVVQVNGAYCQMVQRSRADLTGRVYLEAFQVADREQVLASYRERFQRRLTERPQEIQMGLWNGRSIWFELTYRFLEDTGASPLLLSQFRDITGRKQAEAEKVRLQEQLLQSQKTEAIGRLAGGVAHDFNNMLHVIMGNTTLALEEIPPGSLLHETMQEVLTSARRSADLTRQLLAFARKQTISPRILDLNQTVVALLKMVQRLIGENIQLSWVPEAALWPVNIDPAQVDQLLVNLCVNARDAIADAGRITIHTANRRLDQDQARAYPDGAPGDYVTLTVSDTGHGIQAATRAHLFEPFFTTKDVGKGTGLGLATVFGIVKQNGGFVDVRSEPNQGAEFTVFLPRSQAAAAVGQRTEPEAPRRGHETVLLVEDEKQVLNLAQRLLTRHGYQVLVAPDPEAALQLAAKHPAPIDLLITDVIMPGMNGKQLHQRIQELKPGIRCIYMSGYTADVIAHHGVLDDHLHFLQKPFTVEALARKVREALDNHG